MSTVASDYVTRKEVKDFITTVNQRWNIVESEEMSSESAESAEDTGRQQRQNLPVVIGSSPTFLFDKIFPFTFEQKIK